MEICVFYSWQSSYRKNCDTIISKAIKKAIIELNQEHTLFQYILKRGGGDVLGAEHIDNNIDRIINSEADIAIVDFTHNGNQPQKDPRTNEWIRLKCMPNTNVVYENGKLEYALGERQVLKVYNTAYGDLKTNLDMPFDLRQQHFPIDFFCDDTIDDEGRKSVIEKLKNNLKKLIIECTDSYLECQKVRYAPLVPLHNEYAKKLWKGSFKKTLLFDNIYDKIRRGQSFRLLGLPGLGKTRMIGEAFRERDIDVYYCDCREQINRDVEQAVDSLMRHRRTSKQTVILDNCSQKLCSRVLDLINGNGYNCQLITIYYDPRENLDSDIEGIFMKVGDATGVIEAMLDSVIDIPKEERESIIGLAGGFPLMAQIMIENFQKGIPVAKISKKDVFERMLGIDSLNSSDQDKLKVLTAFSIFKFIGLYGQHEKLGRFVAGNKIVTNIRGTEDENLQLFKEVHGQYSSMEILEREGNLVQMRLIPLAVYLCKSWFDKQTIDTIGELIEQIRTHQDEWVRNMLIESLSKRITLLSEMPLAKELSDGLTDPDRSPFFSEEVVLSAPGSRLFLAFSEVNPEACALALYRILIGKTDSDIKDMDSVRRNLAWALDRLAFDVRSFKNAMLILARLSLVETEDWLSNNTTGLFVDRFPILLAGTEANLESRITILKELLLDVRYVGLVKKSLHRALALGHFHRSGGAEKQGMRTLKDYEPNYKEVVTYINECFDMLLGLVENQQDMDDIAKTLVNNAREYYMNGMDDFLIKGLEVVAFKKNYIWEEMKDVLTSLIEYDAPKRRNHRLEEISKWKRNLTRDDYVYTLLHAGKEINRHYKGSFEEEQKKIHARYGELAKEFIDKELYKDDGVMTSIMGGKCFYYNSYGIVLSEYSHNKGVQKELLDKIVYKVLNQEVSHDGESLLLYFLLKVQEPMLLDEVYKKVLQSGKKRLLPAMYAVKAERQEKKEQLFDLLDNGTLSLDDFSGYFNYMSHSSYDVKYVANRLLDYGAKGAQIVLSYCHNLLFGNQGIDEEYEDIGRRCLMQIDLCGIQLDDYLFVHSMNNYLKKHYDEKMALHIQTIQENVLADIQFRDRYYMGRLYNKVLQRYTELLKPRLFELLENEETRHHWIDLLRTSYSQEEGNGEPIYTLISSDVWFEWLKENPNNDKICTLAMLFSYAISGEANPDMLKLIDVYWCEGIKSVLRGRMHSFSWSGSGIPLYRSRIALCEDYINKLTNEEARAWFKQDIDLWKNEIELERLRNAHERVLYN